MGVQIIHNQVDRPLAPKGEHLLYPEPLAGIDILVLTPLSHRLSSRWAESSKPLQGSIATIALRPSRGFFPTPALPVVWSGEAPIHQNGRRPFPWRMTIEIYDGVFLLRNLDRCFGTKSVQNASESSRLPASLVPYLSFRRQ